MTKRDSRKKDFQDWPIWFDIMKVQKHNKQEWRETSLKGRMAESLVYDLLKESGNEVYRIGFEAILPGLTRIEESFKRNSEVGEKIRSIPDFFVIDKSGDPYLVEVKFRWHPSGHENDPKKLVRIKSSWSECFIFFVNCSEKPYFRVSKTPYINSSGQLVTEPAQNLKFLGITSGLLDKFDALVEKYLTPTLNK